ncbi:hypothetical protein CROQUDRAFT_110063 [Cronartium quercuum f. sp. fusiforme G11]|uniref:Uncharacterized protein n=1 Tax=Cronartium quercuum f. sp. fusiforme G11 TaxID=708437 RepID=A0A9P6NDE7_9BASI|nr:hypothetical protein CROQUDRAFT_110063 [Cronartium quercuum f. sp. fusiforme G11]
MEVCQCSQCATQTSTHPNGTVYSGQYLLSRNARKHRIRDAEERQQLPDLTTKLNLVSAPPTNQIHHSKNLEEDILSDESGEDTSEFSLIHLGKLSQAYLSWLHLCGGLSLAQCQLSRDLVVGLLNFMQSHANKTLIERVIPKDPRTILKNLVSSNINVQKIVCCSTCFTLYDDPQKTPWNCEYRETPKSSKCNTPLFRQKDTHLGNSHKGIT